MRLTALELYWHTVAIGLTAAAMESLEHDELLTAIHVRPQPHCELQVWLLGILPQLEERISRHAHVQEPDDQFSRIEGEIYRLVRLHAEGLPRPAPQAITFLRDGLRCLTLEVPQPTPLTAGGEPGFPLF